MNDERKHHVQRALWYLIPGIVSGLLTGGIAYGTIKTHIQYLQRDIDRIEERAIDNTQEINSHRIREH